MGVANAAKIRTVQVTGTVSYPAQGLQGRLEAYYKSPNKFFAKITLQGVGEILQGYDGKIGWAKNPMTGLRELQGAELAQLRWSAETGASNDLRKALRNPKTRRTREGRQPRDLRADSANNGRQPPQNYISIRNATSPSAWT
jgi:hypothetical protein